MDIDMSRPGGELFPESSPQNYNSYQGVTQDQVAGDPLDMGVRVDVAGQQGQPLSDKEMNFRALGEEISKMKAEREYWKGQAEAYKTIPQQPQQLQGPKEDPFKNLDDDVRGALQALQREGQEREQKLLDQLAAVQAKAQHADWNQAVTQHVPKLTERNPIFAEMIRNSSNPYEAAYALADIARGTQQQPAPVQQPMSMDAQRALINSQKPLSVASIGGRGQLSQADYYAQMSEKDFMELAAKNMANI